MAVGDGVTDDTIAIQTAMTLCPSNQFVFLPAGSYKVTSPINIGSSHGPAWRGFFRAGCD